MLGFFFFFWGCWINTSAKREQELEDGATVDVGESDLWLRRNGDVSTSFSEDGGDWGRAKQREAGDVAPRKGVVVGGAEGGYEQGRGDSQREIKERRSKHLPHLECDLGSCNQMGLRQVNKTDKKNRLNARERRRNERGIIPRWKGWRQRLRKKLVYYLGLESVGESREREIKDVGQTENRERRSDFGKIRSNLCSRASI